jgi:hypothetical protein
MKVFMMAALGALLLGACTQTLGGDGPDTQVQYVTRDGQSIPVQCGYSCGDPSKVANGSGSGAGAGGAAGGGNGK